MDFNDHDSTVVIRLIYVCSNIEFYCLEAFHTKYLLFDPRVAIDINMVCPYRSGNLVSPGDGTENRKAPQDLVL